MATYRIIDDFSIGDTYKLIRDLESVPDEQVITDAFWTVKENIIDSDAAALISIHITQYTTSSGIGEITNYEDGSSRLQFIASPSDSLMMDSLSIYYYDIHINLDSGNKYCLETGKLFTDRHVTQLH